MGVLAATIIDPASSPAWATLGRGFNYFSQISIDANSDIIKSPVFGYQVGVSGLSFVNPDYSDRKVLYYDGNTFTEINSDIRDIGMGLRLYFPAQADLLSGNSDTSSYWLFWNSSTEVAAKTDRSKIYLLLSDCDDIGDFINVGPGQWTASAGRVVAPFALNTYAVLNSDPGTADIEYYGLVNRLDGTGNAGLDIRGDLAGNSWMCQITWVNTIALNAIPSGGGGSTSFSNSGDTDYVIKIKVVGNQWQAWASVAGTPISGSPLLNFTNATFNTNRYAGVSARHWISGPTSNHDNLYGLKAVSSDPDVTLGAVQNVSDYLGRNIAAVVQSASPVRVATLERTSNLRGVFVT